MNFENADFQAGFVLLIDKPYKWMSFDVVKKIKFCLQKKFNIKKLKVGHAGTLDPLASGLMIICTGKSTKTINNYMAQEKEYYAKLYLGATTPSFDLETEIDKEYSVKHITQKQVEQTIKNFIGQQKQIPPSFSAKKINGERSYEKARHGIYVKLDPVEINIKEIEMLEYDMPYLSIRIVCSKGTYIRGLARDIGTSLNIGAYLAELKRTRIGDYLLENALSINEFEKKLNNI